MNISEIIDRSPISTFQVRVVVLCALVALADGFDIQATVFVAPTLAAEWSLPAGTLGPILSASFLGLALGAMTMGILGDRFGRRRILILAFTLVGATSILTALAATPAQLMVLRVLTGIGIGGCLPNFTALTAEYMPARRVSLVVTIMYSAVPLGGVLGGYFAGEVIAQFGWRAVFLIGGVFPLAATILLFWWLPESIRFLANSGRDREQVVGILKRINPSLQLTQGEITWDQGQPAAPLPELFRDGRGVVTITLWIVFFFSLAGMYLLTSWLPSIFSREGWPMARAIQTVSYFQLGGIAGGWIIGWLGDRVGALRVLPWSYLIASLLVAAIGQLSGSDGLVTALVAVAGFAVIGSQTGATALAASMYPTQARSTGVGWGLGVGRLGAVVSPTLVGIALAAHWDKPQLFGAAAVPPLLCAIAISVLWLVRRSASQEIAGDLRSRAA